MPSTDNPTIGPGSSPAPGCVILATILTVFGGLAILYTIVANVQNRRLGGFTEDQPAKIETFAPSAEQTEKANQKLGDLVRAALTNESDRVLFSADDLNTLIATRELLKDFRGQTFIRKIGAEGIEAEMSQPMRKGFSAADGVISTAPLS